MANSYADQAEQIRAQGPRAAMIGAAFVIALFLGMGLLLAGVADGMALPWVGAGFIITMGLALVVGASKTSSN